MNSYDPMTMVSAATPVAGGQRYSDSMFGPGNSGQGLGGGPGGWMNPGMMQVSRMQAAYRYPGMRQMMGMQGRGMGGGMRQPGQPPGYGFNGPPAPVPGNPTGLPGGGAMAAGGPTPLDGIVSPLARL